MRKKKGRPKTSPIWKIEIVALDELVQQSKTLREVLAFFGLKSHGNNVNTLHKRCRKDRIDLSKFKQNQGVGRIGPTRPLEEVLVKNSDYNRGHLKKRLLDKGLLENQCQICNQQPIWNKQRLVLVLDHINGIKDDNRAINLRECTVKENNRNCSMRSTNTTGYKGVSKSKNKRLTSDKWIAMIGTDEGPRYLGIFKSPKEAAAAYDVAAIEHHKEFCLTNKSMGLL